MKRSEQILDVELSNAILLSLQGDFDHPKTPPLQVAATDRLSLADEIYGLSVFWARAKEIFPFWKHRTMDWDQLFRDHLSELVASGPLELADYYDFLQTFAASLGEGHTYVRFPAEIQKQWRYPSLQLDPLVVNGDIGMVVSSGELPRGTQLIEVDGIPVRQMVERVASMTSASTPQDRFAKVADTLLRRNQGDSVSVKAILPDGSMVSWRGVAEHIPQPRKYEMQKFDDGIVYVALPHFQTAEIASSFHDAFPNFDGIRGIVLDLRRNSGGNSGNGYEILKRLISEPVSPYHVRVPVNAPVLGSWGMAARFWLAPRDQHGIYPNYDLPSFGGPVVVMASACTYSAAEDFIVAFKAAKRGAVVGQPTGGSTGQSVYFPLPGGGTGQIVGVWDIDAAGNEFVGAGIAPDIHVTPELIDYSGNRDRALDTALATIRSDISQQGG